MSDLDPADSSIPQSLVNALKDRLSHPVAGIFIIAWILFNWRMLFFLVVAGSPAEARITASLNYTNWILGFWWPLGATVAYLVLSPWLQVLVSRWNGWVAEKQSLRAYQDSLIQLQRQVEIEQRAMQSIQPALRGQQEQKVRLEREIERLIERKAEIETGANNLMELTDPRWRFDGNIPYVSLAEKFKNVAELAKRLSAQHPQLKAHLEKLG